MFPAEQRTHFLPLDAFPPGEGDTGGQATMSPWFTPVHPRSPDSPFTSFSGFGFPFILLAQTVKDLPAVQETWI